MDAARSSGTWLDKYRWLEAWTERELTALLAGQDREAPDDALEQEMAWKAERRRVGQHLSAAVRSGDLIVIWLPGIQRRAQAAGVDDILTIAEQEFGGALDRYRVRRDDVIRWATKHPERFPNFPFMLADIDVAAPAATSSGAPAGSQSPIDRRAQVDDCLKAVNAISSYKEPVQRQHLWKAAKHRDKTQFQRWQAKSPKTNAPDEKTFNRLVTMPPEELLELLVKQKLFGQPKRRGRTRAASSSSPRKR